MIEPVVQALEAYSEHMGRASSQQSWDFEKSKAQALSSLEGGKDKSRKGSLDAAIVDLVGFLNAQPDYVTTSSCSGRIALFQDLEGGVCRKGLGRWLLSSHGPVEPTAVEEAIHSCQALGYEGGCVTLKQEPLILHVECRSLVAAEHLLRIAVGCGFRESGITIGKSGKTMVAIRTKSNVLEAPVVVEGQLLMTTEGLRMLAEHANHKFRLNVDRTEKLFKALRSDAIRDGEATIGKERRMAAEKRHRSHKAAPVSSLEQAWAPPTSSLQEARADKWVWSEEDRWRGEGGWLLRRWGHSLCSAGDKVWIFGGYGMKSANKALGRLSSTVELDLRIGRARDLQTGPEGMTPEAREKHAAALMRFSPSAPPNSGKYETDNREATKLLMVVYGGRASPLKAMGDLWVLELDTAGDECRGSWRVIEGAQGRPPSPRWHHSMEAVGSNAVVVYGGRNQSTVFGGNLHVLTMTNIDTWVWSEVTTTEPVPLPPLFAHTCTALGPSRSQSLLIYGGMHDLTGRNICQQGYMVDVQCGQASLVSCAEPSRYGHSAAYDLGSGSVIVSGGVLHDESDCSGARSLLIFNVDKLSRDGQEVVRQVTSSYPEGYPEPPLVHHTSTIDSCSANNGSHRLVTVGGGLQTFAFAPVLCPPLSIELSLQHTARSRPRQPTKAHSTKAVDAGGSSRSHVDVDGDDVGGGGGGGGGNGAETRAKGDQREVVENGSDWITSGPSAEPRGVRPHCLMARVRHTKRVKTALERGDLFDRAWKIAPVAPEHIEAPALTHHATEKLMAVPVVDTSIRELADIVEGSTTTVDGLSDGVKVFLGAVGGLEGVREMVLGCVQQELPQSQVAANDRVTRLRGQLETLLQRHSLPVALLDDIPAKYEKLGDVLLLADGDFRGPWEKCHTDLWPILTHVLGCTRVARSARIEISTKRRSQVVLLYPEKDPSAPDTGPGSAGWVTVRENGLTYSFDCTKVMFSSGNVTEKARMGQICQRLGEVVVDLYAGIGYYVVPFLVHGGCSHVYACEWNDDAVVSLRHNLEANGVADRATVLVGDNRVTSRELDAVANRVNLGLLPSSEEGWPLAVRVLKDVGGWLHVHGNVLDSTCQQWVRRVEETIAELAVQMGRPWCKRVCCNHVERVKSYAPGVSHVVADVKCGEPYDTES